MSAPLTNDPRHIIQIAVDGDGIVHALAADGTAWYYNLASWHQIPPLPTDDVLTALQEASRKAYPETYGKAADAQARWAAALRPWT